MPKASVKRLIECKKNDLIKLVLDIEKYPEFVPFCFDAKIYENKNEGDLNKIIADLSIGKGPFKDTYKSDVVFNKIKDTIFVKNIDYNYNTNNSPKIVLYAGNLGFGQGLNKFVTSFSKNLPPNWIFKIVGNGNQFNSINNLVLLEIFLE